MTRLVVAPLKGVVRVRGDGSTFTERRPDFGDAEKTLDQRLLSWGTAIRREPGKGEIEVARCCWVDATDDELAMMEKTAGVRILNDLGDLSAATGTLALQPPSWPTKEQAFADAAVAASIGDVATQKALLDEVSILDKECIDFHRGAFEELVGSYASAAAVVDPALLVQPVAGPIGGAVVDVLLVLLTAGLAAALHRFGLSHVGLALTLLHSDNFNRSNTTDFGGQTMSDGLGTWEINNPAVGISSNQCYQSIGSPTEDAHDSAMSSVDEQQSEVTIATLDACGPMDRTPGSDRRYYWGYVYSNGQGVLYHMNGASFDNLGQTSTGQFHAGDVVAIYSTGNNHSVLQNGSTVIGPVSDSSFTSGRCGVAFDAASTGRLDNFNDYVAGSAPTAKTGVCSTV